MRLTKYFKDSWNSRKKHKNCVYCNNYLNYCFHFVDSQKKEYMLPSIRYTHNLLILHFNVGKEVAEIINDLLCMKIDIFFYCHERAKSCTRFYHQNYQGDNWRFFKTQIDLENLWVKLPQNVSINLDTLSENTVTIQLYLKNCVHGRALRIRSVDNRRICEKMEYYNTWRIISFPDFCNEIDKIFEEFVKIN